MELDVPSRCNATKLRRAARHVSRFYDACLASSGLKATQFSILGYLKHRGPMTIMRLAELLTMDRATIGHNLRPLERDGLVSLLPNPADGRSKIVAVTAEGLSRIELARPGWDRAQAEFERVYGSDAATSMRRTLDQVAAGDFAAPATK